MDDFRLMADAIEAEIRSGQLKAGVRLLPQREFARSRGIATSTAARVYQELVRRGLVSGEIGRGTFVLTGSARATPVTEPEQHHLIDLEANFPVLVEQPAMIAAAIGSLLQPQTLGRALQPVGPSGSAPDRHAVAQFLNRALWTPDPAHVLFTTSGRQGIAAAISALVGPGQRLGVEELTYPVVKSIAAHLGVTLVPLRMDEHGLVPTELVAVHRAAPLNAVYLQPSVHNPLGVTMPPARRTEVAATLAALNLTAIEDGVNSFLRDDEPLALFAPDHTVYVDSLSKRVAPGFNLGVMISPPRLRDAFAAAIRSGPWTAIGFAVAAATMLIADGTAAKIVELKRADAAARQRIVLERLAGFSIQADPAAYHSWWELPAPWQAETFVSAASRQGIAISPAASFAVTPSRVHAVRISNSSPNLLILTEALDVLAGLARRTPEDAGLDY